MVPNFVAFINIKSSVEESNDGNTDTDKRKLVEWESNGGNMNYRGGF